MLIEVSKKEFKHRFAKAPHPFISDDFIMLNKHKTDRVVRLIENQQKVSLGLIAGIKEQILNTSFSSPFGGFYCRNENIYVNEIETFVVDLKDYLDRNNLETGIITLPPDIYQKSVNAKFINTFLRLGFQMKIPEITNWIDLRTFNGSFQQRSSREYYNQALKNNLHFNLLKKEQEKIEAFELIKQNRARFGRPIYMTFEDIEKTAEIFPTDFFSVTSENGSFIASAIFYRFPNSIAFALFWGDSEEGRPLRAMDYLVYQLICFYKNKDFSFIDLGISTEAGMPNQGLLRFKETHDCYSSIRMTFVI